MHPRHATPAITSVLLGIVAGTAMQVQLQELWSVAAHGLLLLAAFAMVVLRRIAPRALLFAAAAAAAFSVAGLRAHSQLADALDASAEGRDVVLAGTVAAMPQRTDSGTRFRFDVESAQGAEGEVRVPPRVYIGWYGTEGAAPPDVRAGDRWRFATRLKAPHGNANPNGFDYELWLWEQGLQATGYVRSGPRDPAPARLARTWAHPVEQARQAVRDAIFERIGDRRDAGVIAALVVGDQGAIERADWDVFRATGVAHLMSISGLHVTMFAWAASLAIGAAWRRSTRLCMAVPAQHAALAGGWLLAASYALFSGWGVPAQRTVCMLGVVGLLRLSARRWPWTHVWLLACATVLSLDPWAVMQAGFWLSFVAVGVLFASTPAASRAATTAGRLRAAAHEQWVVTIALTPLSILLFGQVSVVGLLANAFAIPWLTLVVTPLGMAGVAVPASWSLAAGAIGLLSAALQWLASWPLASLSVAAPPVWAGVAGVAGGLLLALPVPAAWRLAGIPMLLPVLLWLPHRPGAGEFELVFADVGQGNAVIVRTAAHTLVYDAGPRYGPDSDAGHRVLVPLLRAGGERVDTLVLSHRDTDHTGGAAAVLAMHPRAALLSSIEAGHELQQLRPAQRCTAGQAWAWDGVEFAVLHPQPADYDEPRKPNFVSCVLRVSNGRTSALLAGDIEAPQEDRLVRDGMAHADVLLLPHHGSKTSSTPAFLAQVAPAMAVIQAGYRNRFGHPAPPVVERLREAGIRIVDSPHCGAATWRSAEPKEVRCHRDGARRYWHHRVP